MNKLAVVKSDLRDGIKAGDIVEVLPKRKVEGDGLFRVLLLDSDFVFALAHPHEIDFMDDSVADIIRSSL